jgi:hypothetical protein
MLTKLRIADILHLEYSKTYSALESFFYGKNKSADKRLFYFEYFRDNFQAVTSVTIESPYSKGVIIGMWEEFSENTPIQFEYYFNDDGDYHYLTRGYSTDGHITVKKGDQLVTIAKAAGVTEEDIYYISKQGKDRVEFKGFASAFEEFTKLLKD